MLWDVIIAPVTLISQLNYRAEMGENGANALFSGCGNEMRGLHVLPAAACGPVIGTLNTFASYYQVSATSVNPQSSLRSDSPL